jgi:hypothetical protein
MAGVTYTADVEPILTVHGCTGCHGGTEGLTITYANLISGLSVAAEGCNPPRKYVVAGSPTTSYLLEKVEGVNLCAASARMPPGGPYLSTAEIQTITNWICDGAKQ